MLELSRRGLVRILAGLSLIVAVVVGPGVSPVLAMLPGPSNDPGASNYSSAKTGYDASYPQCGKSLPAVATTGVAYSFAVLGVNHGQAFTPNTCLADEYWAGGQTGSSPAFYIDLNSPTPTTAIFGHHGPRGSCAADDLACASYNFGYNGAAIAFEYAAAAVGTAAAASGTWWLDVETGKPWSSNRYANSQVIQGSIDYFQDHALAVGAYSVTGLWNQVVGPDYRPAIPAWYAPARTFAQAPRTCASQSFTGGPIVIVQIAHNDLDEDYSCE